MTTTAERSGYEARVRRLGDNLARMLETLWARYESGEIDLATFTDLAAIVVVTANGQAASVARLSVAAYVAQQTGDTLPAVTGDPPDYRTNPDRVRKGLETITGEAPETAPGRLTRLGHTEPASSAAEAYAAVIATWDRNVITGYTRQLESDPCDLCQWWAAESHKFPPTAQMPRHDGCLCTQLPIVNT